MFNYNLNSDIKQRPNFCSSTCIIDLSSESTCCKTERCDGDIQTTDISISVMQDLYSLNKTTASLDAGNKVENTSEPYTIPTSLKILPIYIMTQSIICWSSIFPGKLLFIIR